MTRLRALVTAGGTREPIDDVRVISNRSRGRFGAAIVRELLAAGVETTVLGSSAALALLEDEQVERVPFEAYADLARELERLTAEPPDLLFMAAAVSDYTPVRREGKIRSTADELTIRLKKTKKILAGLRERCGVETFLIGFKLLSGVTREELVGTAAAQVRGCRLNLCVANDMSEFTESDHPITLVTPEGGAIRVDGARDSVAHSLVEFTLRRARVTWSRSTCVGEAPQGAGRERAGALLSLAQDAGLLVHGPDGNVTTRSDGATFWATPRQVDKADVREGDLLHVEVDLDARQVRYLGARRPSIDASVHGWLYAHLPRLDSLVHFHDALLLPTAWTDFPYPCGTREEAEAVHEALRLAALAGRYDGGAFAIQLVEHGLLLGLERGGVERLRGEWQAAREAYQQHLEQLGTSTDDKTLTPIFDGPRIVGIRARGAEPRWTSVFLLPSARGGGLGERIVERLDRDGDTIAVHDDCGVLEFYRDRGYRLRERDGEVSYLIPPSLRDDAIEAASICLWDPVGQRVLLGQRKTIPGKGLWTFPGGRMQPGETALQAGLRELEEETGLHPATSDASLQQTLNVGADGQCFRITCSTVLCLDPRDPQETTELAARWLTLSEALQLELAPGTRRTLRGLPVSLRP